MRRSVVLACVAVILGFTVMSVRADSEPTKEESPAASKAHTPKRTYGKKSKPQNEPKQEETKTEVVASESKSQEAVGAEGVGKEPVELTMPEEPKVAEEAKTEQTPQVAKEKKEESQKPEASVAPKKTPVVVVLTLSGEYPEGPGAPGLFGELQPSLSAMVKRLESAATDKEVAAVWLKIGDVSLGRGKVAELRGAIAKIRKANKPVYAELSTADGRQYLVASACDQIMIAPAGLLLIPGVRAELTFCKGLLDKLGLEFDALQMGKYKGAAEPLTRNEMSEPLRESMEAIVDDTYDDLVATIAADRQIAPEQVKTLIDQGLFTAAAARKAGLVDDALYADQIQDAIAKKLDSDAVNVVANYKKKRIDTDFSGFGGMMKLMEVMMGGKPSESTSKKQKIAIVYAVGPIVEGKSKSELFGSTTLGSTTLIAAIKKAAEDPKVSAIVLRIDSPGGSATASDLIWRETVRAQKPVIASMGDVAGSGGYYIAMGAKKIIAAPGTLTGSIGVIGGKLVTRGLYEKIGLNTQVISRGKNSGAISSSQPFTPEERKAWTETLQDVYAQFVSKAAEGRKMRYDKLEELAQGRVYTGRMAQRLGLVDSLGTLDDAINAGKEAAGLDANAEIELMVLPEAKSVFEQLFGDPSASTDLDSILPEGFGISLLRQAAQLRELLATPTLYWMPYTIELK